LLRTRRAEERARESSVQLQSTFDSISDGICLLDRDGRVVRCNQALGRMLGQAEEQIIGRGHESLLPATASGVESDPFRRMAKSRHREVVTSMHQGRLLRVSSDPVLDEQGQLSGAVYIFTDVTEQKRAEEEREQLLGRERLARSEAQ